MNLSGFGRVVKVGLPLQKGLELRAETDTGSGSGATESPARALSAEKTDSGWPPALSDKPSFSGRFPAISEINNLCVSKRRLKKRPC
jgi:hypothetical protein